MLEKHGLATMIILAAASLASAQTPDIIEQIGPLLGSLGAPQPKLPPLEKLNEAVWGKPLNGLQAGIRSAPSPASPAAVATFDIIVRNVGKETVSFSHLNLAFGGDNVDGTVTAKGQEVTSEIIPKGKRYTVKVGPGESRSLGLLPAFAPGGGADWKRPAAMLQRGPNHLGAEAIAVRLEGGKDLELATGYVDVSWPAAAK